MNAAVKRYKHSLGASLIVALVLLSPTTVFAAGSSEPNYTQEVKTAERLIYKEKYAKAIRKLEAVVDAKPKNANAWNLLGFAHRKNDNLEAATSAYENALTIDPAHKGALEYQGELFIRLGNIEGAKANLEKLQAACPDGCEELELLTQALAST